MYKCNKSGLKKNRLETHDHEVVSSNPNDECGRCIILPFICCKNVLLLF